RAATGHAAAPPMSVMKSRRRIASPGLGDDFNQIRKPRPAEWGYRLGLRVPGVRAFQSRQVAPLIWSIVDADGARACVFHTAGPTPALLALGRLPTGVMNRTEAAYDAHLKQLQLVGDVLWHRFEPLKPRLKRTRSATRAAPRAAHVAATPPNSMMNSRRFN